MMLNFVVFLSELLTFVRENTVIAKEIADR